MRNMINDIFEQSILLKRKVIEDDGAIALEKIGNDIIASILAGNKLLICGNGGSASDAQHLAAEMLVRLRSNNNREGVPAISLALDTSTITACGNDFGFDALYERMVSAIGNSGDVLMGISTTGNSKNVIRAMIAARKLGIKVVGFLGSGGGDAAKWCDEAFIVPSDNTGRVQEVHITAGHAVMEYVEDQLLERGYLTIK